MKYRETIYEIDEEALQKVEERLFDLELFGYAVESSEGKLILRSYDPRIDEVLRDLGLSPSSSSLVDPTEWAKEMIKEPFEIADGIVVDPTGEYRGPGLVIHIPPGMAFGTGIHPTTRLCARAIKRHLREGMSVLDVGTGSGILAILAKKLGASRVVAVDVDPLAVEVAIENAARNDVEIEVKTSDLLEKVEGKFDLIVANIVPKVLIDLSKQLQSTVRDESILILSGIERSKFAEVKGVYEEKGFKVLEVEEEDEWIAMTLKSSKDSLEGR